MSLVLRTRGAFLVLAPLSGFLCDPHTTLYVTAGCRRSRRTCSKERSSKIFSRTLEHQIFWLCLRVKGLCSAQHSFLLTTHTVLKDFDFIWKLDSFQVLWPSKSCFGRRIFAILGLPASFWHASPLAHFLLKTVGRLLTGPRLSQRLPGLIAINGNSLCFSFSERITTALSASNKCKSRASGEKELRSHSNFCGCAGFTQNAQFSHYQPPRTSHLQGIENALSMSLEIPPYNPARRKSAQQQQAIPSTPASTSAQQAYPSPASIPRPGTSSSQRSNSSNGSAPVNQPNTRIPVSHQTSHRPASTTVIPVPYTPEGSSSNENRRDAATTGARNKADRNTHQITVNAPHTTGTSNPNDKTQGMGIYQPPLTGGNSEFGKVKLGVRGDASVSRSTYSMHTANVPFVSRWGEEVAIKLIKKRECSGFCN